MLPDVSARARDHWLASFGAGAAQRLLRARPHLTRRGNGGKDRCWYEIEPAGIYRNERLPWNLLGQEWWPSKVWEGQSGLLLEPSEPN